MHILIVHDQKIPVAGYGGTERVIWGLAKSLRDLGHQVTFLVPQGSYCPFASVIIWNPLVSLNAQIPASVDVVHLNHTPSETMIKPYVVTVHGNVPAETILDINSIFVSQNHANRYGSESFIHNGLDWSDYGKPNLAQSRNHFHFLGKAAWRVKNVQGAIDTTLQSPNEQLAVLGGTRLNLKMGFRMTWSPRIQFYGTVGGQQKLDLLGQSKGLIFPVRWHEPFGLAITESLYFGCPIFATPYGSLPELVKPEFGVLSDQQSALSDAIQHASDFSKEACHDYARDVFDAQSMAKKYMIAYECVLNGRTLNTQNPQLIEKNPPKFLPWNNKSL
ncbi:glycosyltransferase [Aquirufa sp. LEPPI-3A]|uniref:glycosyltransferase n=1 Tax=Aquirufa regiilacus TaxID=3024868 RepID=UPI0028DFE903|nr:glycosyltransferase [Aquirufa sp. LEPPI-3A]MDT8888141.1 glycosyltransferase [Aquirufa sp. LEPPI-3A]